MSLDDPPPVLSPTDDDDGRLPGGPVHVLHVDDEPSLLDLVADALERENDRFVVTTATDAEAGLDLLAAGGFDCVVSDYSMPGTDGLGFLEAVRADHSDLPFILYTGNGDEGIASRAISAGVTDYLRKGTGTDQYAVLANRIENAVERYRAQRAVERGFRVMDSAREGISILDEDGYFVYVNDAYADIVGYDRTDLLGHHWGLLYPDETVESVREEILPEIPTEGRWTGETVYVRGDGERILVDHALAYADGGTMICLVRDLTHDGNGGDAGDGNDARGAGDGSADRGDEHDGGSDDHDGRSGRAAGSGPLVGEDAFVECVLNALEDVFYVLDVDGEVVHVNDRATEVTGFPTAELVSMTARDVVADDDERVVEEAIAETLQTGESTVEAALRTAEGDAIPHEFRTRRLADPQGNVIGLVGIGRDVTERNRREQRLERQARQFEAFGSVLRHDLRNPLNVVQGRLEMLGDAVESAPAAEEGVLTADGEADGETDAVVVDREAVRDHVDAADRATERLDALVADLASVMREGDLVSEVEDADLAAAARTAWEALETERATLDVVDDAVVRADQQALERLFDNLLGNAIEHGEPDVSVAVGRLDDGFYVADDGPGIPPANRDEVFEPGVSTKGDGTGFGLASVHQIVLAHGWDVSVTESDAGGARFEIRDVSVVD